MPFTREQTSELKQIIKEGIAASFRDDSIIANLVDKVSQKINLQLLTDRIQQQESHIKRLEEQVTDLREKLDAVERHSRIKTIRVHGISEVNGENVQEKVLGVFNSKMDLNVNSCELDKCHRIGMRTNERPRAVLVTFLRLEMKQDVIRARKKLKGSNVVIVEDLTHDKHEVYKEAVRVLGHRKVWTLGGCVYTKLNNRKQEIKCKADIPRVDRHGK